MPPIANRMVKRPSVIPSTDRLLEHSEVIPYDEPRDLFFGVARLEKATRQIRPIAVTLIPVDARRPVEVTHLLRAEPHAVDEHGLGCLEQFARHRGIAVMIGADADVLGTGDVD